ncbi:MAG: hypothetical protein HFE44_15860 [Oscillospiraceae bacterium]|nr:hypothetical protein [Oscillospiraceae bacterium]
MSNREFAKNLIDYVPENKLLYVVGYLQGIVVPDETPNTATIAAIQELESGGGELWTGSTEDFFAMLDAEDEANA